MRRWLAGLAIIVLVTGMLYSRLARATDYLITEALIGKVSTNCSQIKVRLKQVQVNDALTRVNQGQFFESTANNLMTPLNVRLVANNYNPIELLSLNKEYDKYLTTFRQQYMTYEEALIDLIQQDCRHQPAQFYDKLQAVRSLRQQLQLTNQSLNQLIQQYFTKAKQLYEQAQ